MPSSVSLIAFLNTVLLISCATQEQASDKRNIATGDSAVSIRNVPAVPGPLTNMLNAYYKVKDAFVRTDGTGVDMAAMQLRLSIDSLSAEKMEIDSSYTTVINSHKKDMLSAIDQIIKQREIQTKRLDFVALSGNLYRLLKATPYKGETVYQLHCPMAFGTGANWLSDQKVIANPYYGDKMMDCGEVIDSLAGK